MDPSRRQTVLQNSSEIRSQTEELEHLEQEITLTLQEIDRNFARSHKIVNESIIPVVKKYGAASKGVWDGVKFWEAFFEASANVTLSGYKEAVNQEEQGPSMISSDLVSTSFNQQIPIHDITKDLTALASISGTNGTDELSSRLERVGLNDSIQLQKSRQINDDSTITDFKKPFALQKVIKNEVTNDSILRGLDLEDQSTPYKGQSKFPSSFKQINNTIGDDTSSIYPEMPHVKSKAGLSYDSIDDEPPVPIPTSHLSVINESSSLPYTPTGSSKMSSLSIQNLHTPQSLHPDFQQQQQQQQQEQQQSRYDFDDDDEDDDIIMNSSPFKTENINPSSYTPGFTNNIIMHRVLDQNYRIQATPNHSSYRRPGLPITSVSRNNNNKTPDRETRRKTIMAKYDSSPLTISPPKLTSWKSNNNNDAVTPIRSKIKNKNRNENQNQLSRFPTTPKYGGGVDLLKTPRRNITNNYNYDHDDNTTTAGITTTNVFNRNEIGATTSTSAANLPAESFYDSDSDSDVILGMSPPVTYQFTVPVSKLEKTPARQVAHNLVEDMLRTVGGEDSTNTNSVNFSTNIGGTSLNNKLKSLDTGNITNSFIDHQYTIDEDINWSDDDL